MSNNRFSPDLFSGPELIFDERKFALKKSERLVLSLLAIAGIIGLIYLGQCKAILGKHHSEKCQAWKKEITQNNPALIDEQATIASTN